MTFSTERDWKDGEQMKVLDFKTIEPFFSQERDGIKPFTVRRWDDTDSRFMALERSYGFSIRIRNPDTGESFIRELVSWDYIKRNSWKPIEPRWIILFLGDRVDVLL